MQAKNLFKIMPLRLYKMDKKSNRYRVCPNDGEEFMANDRTEIHCCPQCADEFHNTKKKIAKLIEKNLCETDIVLNEIKEQRNMIKKNLLVLENLELDKKGSVFDLDYLFSLGFDSFLYNSKTSIFFKDKTTKRYYTQFENYRIFSVGFSEVLIKKII
jgi:hypothetical protein